MLLRSEFAPSDDLWDLVWEATRRAVAHLDAHGRLDGVLLVVAEPREDPVTGAVRQSLLPSAELARTELAAGPRPWRAAILWHDRADASLRMDAHDAGDELGGRFRASVRKRPLRGWQADEDGPEFPEEIETFF